MENGNEKDAHSWIQKEIIEIKRHKEKRGIGEIDTLRRYRGQKESSEELT